MQMTNVTVRVPKIAIDAMIGDGSIPPKHVEGVCATTLVAGIVIAQPKSFTREQIKEIDQWGESILSAVGNEE